MAGKNSILKNLGAYLLSGSLAAGIGYSEAIAQDNSKLKADSLALIKKEYEFLSPNEKAKLQPLYYDSKDNDTTINTPKTKKPAANQIYSKGEMTVVGDGILAKSYVNEVELTLHANISLKELFYSKDRQRYYFTDAKQGLEKIVRNMKPDKSLTGKEKAFKQYLTGLSKSLKSSDKSSLRILNEAVKDGVIAAEQDSLYNKNGWKVNEGVYMAVVKTKSQSVPILFRFKPGKLEKKEKKEIGFIVEEDTITAKIYKEYREKKPFMVMNDDSLYLLVPYDSLTYEQKEEYLDKFREFEIKARGNIKKILPGLYVRIKEKKEERKRLGFGLETALGTNKEAVIGAFVEVPLTSWLGIEGFGDYYVARGNPVFSDKNTKVNLKERQLIGPKTYKQRTDEITTTTEDKAIADFGAGLAFKLIKGLEIPLRVALNVSSQEKTLDGKSTITYERDMQLLEPPSVITNTAKESKLTTNLSLSAGARCNLTKNLAVGASFNRTGKANSGRLNFRWKF